MPFSDFKQSVLRFDFSFSGNSVESSFSNFLFACPLLVVVAPDGNFYLKMGANLPNDIYFKGLPEIQEWFKNGHKNDNRPVLAKALKSLLPSLSIEEIQEKRCIVCYTKHGKPYIGPIEKGLFVAAGGNGYAAMSSDALGKIAATVLLENKFPAEFSAKDFEPVFETETV